MIEIAALVLGLVLVLALSAFSPARRRRSCRSTATGCVTSSEPSRKPRSCATSSPIPRKSWARSSPGTFSSTPRQVRSSPMPSPLSSRPKISRHVRSRSRSRTIVLTALILVFGEMLPKSLAARHPEGWSLLVIRPIAALIRLGAPVVWLLTRVSYGFLSLFGVSTGALSSAVTLEEIKAILYAGGVPEEERGSRRQMLRRVIELGEKRVAEIMVPRTGNGRSREGHPTRRHRSSDPEPAVLAHAPSTTGPWTTSLDFSSPRTSSPIGGRTSRSGSTRSCARRTSSPTRRKSNKRSNSSSIKGPTWRSSSTSTEASKASSPSRIF